jgi:hypothetical protein
MPRVVLAGSEIDTHFAVIDFTIAAAPSVSLVDPGFGAGCRVALSNNVAVIGSVLSGSVRMADVTNPAATVLQGTINTMLSGIGSLAIRGSLVAVGEWVNSFQARVKLLDFSNPMVPVVLGAAPTPLTSNTDSMGNSLAAIGSIAFLNDNVVFVSGPAGLQIYKVDFTNPAAPVVTLFLPTLSGGVSLDLDSGANRLVAGDNNSTILKLFNASTLALVAQANTTLGGVISVALNFPLVLAGSPNDTIAVRVDFSGPPVVTSFNPMLTGGSTTAIENTTGACGDILGSNVKLINLTGATPTILGTANAVIASISTLAMSNFTPPTLTLSPTMLLFNKVRVGTTAMLPLTISNMGTFPLTISGINSSSPRFTFVPATVGPIAPGATVTIQVGFSPNAEIVFTGNLSFTTNDPTHTSVTLPLSGTGALPHIAVSPANLPLGSVPVCLSGTGSFTITNNGDVDLTVNSIISSDPSFTVIPSNGIVGPQANLIVAVNFRPTANGAISGTISINSDDPSQPVKTISVSGTGLPTPPPSITVSPLNLNFGATPVQFFIGLRITVANVGPCQPLSVSMASSGAPFFITDTDPTSLPPSSLSIPTTSINPGQSKRFVVVFAPVAPGIANGNLTISNNDPMQATVTIPLTGNGVVLQSTSMELILDRSGSMAAAAPGGTKMDALKAAVNLFADLVIPGQGDEMGSVEFDDAFTVLTPLGAYDLAKSNAIKADANTLTPRNFTSIGGGLQLGQTQVVGSAIQRKVMLVFTDGLENTPPMIAAVEPAITASGIEVYAIGLGQPQNISTAALQALASSANGKFFLTDDTLILRKNFTQVLADAFRNNMAADPIFSLGAGATKLIPYENTQCEKRISFILNWDNPLSQVELFIEAPDGTVYHPNTVFTNRLVRYEQKPNYCFYQISFPPVDPGSGLVIGPKQIGTWNMHVKGTSLAGASERCTTSVIVESELELKTTVHVTDINSPIQVIAQVNHHGTLVNDAKVILNLTIPLKSLAAVSIPAVIQKALHADQHPISPGKKPLIPVEVKSFQLKYSDKYEGYYIVLPAPKVDGVYQFEFEAGGKACDGKFERYSSNSVYIGPRPDKRKTTITVYMDPFQSRAVVTVILKDANGKLLGPGQSLLIRPEINEQQGSVFGFSDHGDGKYTFEVRWSDKRKVPNLKVRIGGIGIKVNLKGNKAG